MLCADATAKNGYTTIAVFLEQLRFNYGVSDNLELFEKHPKVGYNSSGQPLLFALKHGVQQMQITNMSDSVIVLSSEAGYNHANLESNYLG